MEDRRLRRREFLGTTAKAAGALAAFTAVAPLVQACAPATAPGGGPAQGSAQKGPKLPSYVPLQGLPKPAIGPSADGIVHPTYFSYPKDGLLNAVKAPPGKGGDVTGFSLGVQGVPPPLGENAGWQNLNKRLGVNLKYSLVTAANDYNARFATIMASRDYPDLLWIRDTLFVKGLNQFLEKEYADLGPYLAGDAAKEFPGLAAMPPYAWPNCIRNGTIQAIQRGIVSPFGEGAMVNQALWDRVGGTPKSADDLLRMAKEITRPQQSTYAFVDPLVGSARTAGIRTLMVGMYGGVNKWGLTKGKLVKDIETDEYRAATEFVRKLYEAGTVHPDAASQSLAAQRDLIYQGRGAFNGQNTVGAYLTLWLANTSRIPLRQMVPFSADGKAKPNYHYSRGTNGVTAVKKGSEARVRELLSVASFLAMPFGTLEYQDLMYGVPGVHFNFDAKGNPVTTKVGADHVIGKLNTLVSSTDVIYSQADPEEYGKLQSGYQEQYHAMGISDPTVGLASETQSTEGAVLDQLISDRLLAIVSGKAPMSAYDQMVSEWKSRGGDKVRAEYEEALSR